MRIWKIIVHIQLFLTITQNLGNGSVSHAHYPCNRYQAYFSRVFSVHLPVRFFRHFHYR